MCTAATYKTKCFYFGRNLDYERGFGEQVVITPRLFPLPMRHLPDLTRHYAMIGMASVQDGYPLYYDAVNEKGLCMAGLNFVRSAVYGPCAPGKANVAQFELIPWLLGRCATAAEARDLLAESRITDDAFLPGLPPARLHWLLADREQCFAVEQTAEGLRVYEDPAGVLTNEPPFPMQLFRLNDYAQLSPQPPENRFSPALPLETYSRGMGAMGLPGDLSSPSRFVRAAFTRLNSRSGDGEAESVSQLLHILGAAAQQRGCCVLEDGACELTLYTSCCNADTGVYYYTTYDAAQLSPQPPENRFSPALPLETYSRGMGAMGLPGDLSSPSRFVRAAFTRLNSRSGDGEAESVSQLLHILGAAAQQRGCCVLEDGACELTLYTSCCNADTGVYYYTTYDAAQLCAVDMHRADLDGTVLACQLLDTAWRVHYQN